MFSTSYNIGALEKWSCIGPLKFMYVKVHKPTYLSSLWRFVIGAIHKWICTSRMIHFQILRNKMQRVYASNLLKKQIHLVEYIVVKESVLRDYSTFSYLFCGILVEQKS